MDKQKYAAEVKRLYRASGGKMTREIRSLLQILHKLDNPDTDIGIYGNEMTGRRCRNPQRCAPLHDNHGENSRP